MKLQPVLQTYHMSVLKAMARELGVSGSQKAALVRELARVLNQGEHVEAAVARLTPPERQALGLLQSAGGEVYASALKGKLLKEGVVKPTPKVQPTWRGGDFVTWYEGNPNYRGQPAFEDLIARLTRRGLVLSRVPTRPEGNLIEWTPGEILFIPKGVRTRLPDFAPPPQVGPIEEPPQVLAGSSRAFQRDLGRYWRYIRSKGELRLTTQSYVYKADLKAINEVLSVPGNLGSGRGEADNGRLYFIRRLLPDLGVVKVKPDGNLEPVPDTSFWELPPLERVKRTFEAWRDGTGWNELLQVPTRKRGYHHGHPAPPELKEVRAKVLQHLVEVGAEGWISLDDLIDRIRMRDYGFLFPKRHHQPVYRGYYYYGVQGRERYRTPYYEANNPFTITFEEVKDEADGWEKVEANLIAHIVAGPLFWMGLVDLGYDAGAKPDAVNPPRPLAYRLTKIGAWVLGLGEAVEIPEEGGRIVVQPNFQILAMEPISDQVLITLDHFAEPEGGDRVMTYKLTRQSVYRGQKEGWDVPRIIAYLEQASGMPLPDNVRRSLEEWQALHERIVFRRGVTLVQAADAETLGQLLQDPELAPVLGRRVTETVTLTNGKAQQVAETLRQRGWLPLVTPAGQREAPDSLRADVEGRLRFAHAAPSIHALGRVAPFTETVDGTLRITPKAVQRALRTGHTVDDILKALRSVHVGELPRKLVIDIKAWGKYYGDAQMDTLTLIEFRDHDVLRELLTDPDLAPYLKPFKAGPRPLAVVDRQHLDHVQRLLAERGIEVRWGLDPQAETRS